jgi:hypothetical protein
MRDYRSKSQTAAFAESRGYLSAVRKEKQPDHLVENCVEASISIGERVLKLIESSGEKRRE